MPTFFFDSLKVFRNKEARTVVVFSVVENEKHRLEGRTTIIARRFFFRETTRRLSRKRRKVSKGFSFPSIFFSLLFFFVFVFFLSLSIESIRFFFEERRPWKFYSLFEETALQLCRNGIEVFSFYSFFFSFRSYTRRINFRNFPNWMEKLVNRLQIFGNVSFLSRCECLNVKK